MTLQAIKWQEQKLSILDQLLLPEQSVYIDIKNTDEGWKAIKTMQVRGAPAIAIVGCLSLAAEILNTDFEDLWEMHEFILAKLEYLISARPTAVNMKTAADELSSLSELLTSTEFEASHFKNEIVGWCERMLDQDVATNKLIGEYGSIAIQSLNNNTINLNILTHCNTGSLATAGYGTALGVIRALRDNKLLGHTYCTETRPYNQGARLTAYELVHENIPSTLVCDSMVAALMQSKTIHAVVVGADRVAKNGDTANKIGTYQIALIAKHHKVPFFVCAPTTSIDLNIMSGKEIIVEERPANEVTSIGGVNIAAPGISCWNPAFDVTPAEFITGIVTEKGTFTPQEMSKNITS